MKTVAFCCPRNGTSAFGRQYSKDNNLKYRAEILNYLRYPRNADQNGRQYIEDQIQLWKEDDNSFCKIFPFHISNEIPGISEEELINYCKIIAEASDNIIYIFRRDTTKQILSSIIAEHTGEWNKKREDHSEFPVSDKMFNTYSMAILRNHKTIIKIKDLFPGKVYCVEDYLSDTQHQQYPDQHKNPDNYQYNLENIEKLYNYEKNEPKTKSI
tara:strand:+ start:13 stop:651 length:639 start_codon:yes stop_codon:yes gene_type:complete